MNIDSLTIGEAKVISKMFENFDGAQNTKPLGSNLIGRYVIVRSANEGINAGVISEIDSTGVVLIDARRIWYHKPKNKKISWYEGVAISGLSEDSKISATVGLKAIIEDYSITPCSKDAEISIRGHASHAQK